MRKSVTVLFFFLIALGCYAQKYPVFTHADSLRGTLSPDRSCYDVYFYDLDLVINPGAQYIQGHNTIYFKVVKDFNKMQIDLFRNFVIDSIVMHHVNVKYKRDSNAIIIEFNKTRWLGEKDIKDSGHLVLKEGQKDSIKICYHGNPQIAKKPPWDGGFVWSKDSLGNPWVGVACEGTGASVWWPCKDHLSDKPDSMRMTFAVPYGLTCVCNGRLRRRQELYNGYTRFTWFVSVPIINYDVTLNAGNYVQISDKYISGKDTLDLNYFVLKYNEQKARKQFEQVKPMLACYEKYFGKYPFYKDDYKLVDADYWGMEHQSCVAYGNQYKNNAFGFDFIIIHESAHEWWGNSLSCSDPADMWLHEAFATYAEALYLECTHDYKTSVKYLYSEQKRIGNKYPIIGPYDVNFQGTENDDDEYFKGAWMLHTFRHVINNDSLFFAILKGLQVKFKYASTNSDSVIAYINKVAGKDYTTFFNEYLHEAKPPIFEYKLTEAGKSTILFYRWDSVEDGFEMPLKITSAVNDSGNTYITITPRTRWLSIRLPNFNPKDFSIDLDEFYVIPKKKE